jgi:hypothetical protein
MRALLKIERSKYTKAHTRKQKRDEGRLIVVVESIGSTIGTIVGSANAAEKAPTQSHGIRSVKPTSPTQRNVAH